jgi:DNA-binding response OmpR family regulator
MRRPEVLVVDDDPHILEVLEMRLEAMGFTVTALEDAREALRQVGERSFDLALIDLRMEPVDGLALMKAAHERQARLPVLIMTAHGTIETAVDAIKEGAFDFLTKPFVPEELSGKIRRALSERRWARDRELLGSVGQTLTSTSAIERVLDVVARAALDAAETERTVVFLREGDQLVAKATAGASPVPVEDLEGIAESAMAKREPVKLAGDGDRITLAAPFLVDGIARGALVVENPSYVVPTEDDMGYLMLFAAQAAVALKNAQELERCRSGALLALGRVATQVAHELNNPLGGLMLFVRLLGERLDEAGDADGVGLAQKAAHAIDRLAALVRDITAYGRAMDLERCPTRVNDLVDE